MKRFLTRADGLQGHAVGSCGEVRYTRYKAVCRRCNYYPVPIWRIPFGLCFQCDPPKEQT